MNQRKVLTFAGFVGVLLVLFAVFAWRQFYGFNKNDEIFYISTVYRFFQGDAMLIDEWNNGQMFAFVTYPFYYLIWLLHPSNEGIVWIARMMYLIFQAVVALYMYLRLRRFGWVRMIPALFYFVTTPYNINGLSYNTLAFGFLLLILVTLAGKENISTFDSILCGFFTAWMVLANPYSIFLFVLYGVICLIASLSLWRKGKDVDAVCSLKTFFWMGVGAFVIFVLFCIFVFSRGSLSEIIENLSYIVMDSERQKSFWEKFFKYFIRIYRYYKIQVYLSAFLLLVWLFDRKKRVAPSIYLFLEAIVAMFYMVYYGFFWEMVGINYLLVPLSFVGFLAYLAAEEKDHRLFFAWYLPGLFFTLLAHFATNTGILTVSASYMLTSAASILLIWELVREQDLSWLRIVACILLLVQFTACISQRIFYVWGDEHLPALTCELTEGPLKGIYTSKENERLYQEVLLDMKELSMTSEDTLFVVGIAPWMYLNTEARCAAYSTWETLENDPLIPIYYTARPQKLPTVIYCYAYEASILETDFAYNFIDMGYQSKIMRRGVVLTRR